MDTRSARERMSERLPHRTLREPREFPENALDLVEGERREDLERQLGRLEGRLELAERAEITIREERDRLRTELEETREERDRLLSEMAEERAERKRLEVELEFTRGALGCEIPLDEALAKRLLLRLIDETREEKLSNPIPPGKAPEECSKPPAPEVLTPKEVEVLRLVVQERTNKEIGKALLISVHTVKKHMQQIFAKLGVSDRTQAARKAVELGLHS